MRKNLVDLHAKTMLLYKNVLHILYHGSFCLSKQNDAELIPSANMDIVQDGQFQILTIKDARRQDSGKYELFAKNPCSKRSYDIDVKVQDRPGAPAGPIKFSSVSGEKMTLWWGLPSDDGGAACEKFLVEKRETSRATWNIVNANVEACNLTVNRLLKNHEYQFRVYGIKNLLRRFQLKKF